MPNKVKNVKNKTKSKTKPVKSDKKTKRMFNIFSRSYQYQMTPKGTIEVKVDYQNNNGETDKSFELNSNIKNKKVHLKGKMGKDNVYKINDNKKQHEYKEKTLLNIINKLKEKLSITNNKL